MAANQPRWNPGPHNLLALVALILFVLAALAYHGTITSPSGSVFLACGLAFLAAGFVV